ncbi:redoxin domain-containing protein [Gemmatimonas sp.]|uniref:redoxin domain-containing protein n=1 Tax=Gemmatimonas sp. TaxID=1962908 RepID=UPI0031BD2E20|nr:redoxin domain-containing protein [Gemmatimonas sp.]
MTAGTPALPAVGTEAPDFTAASTSGENITLSSFRGQKHVLLAFFPAAFTPVCTSEMCAFSDDFARFSADDVQVLPISVDTLDSLTSFRDQHHMKVELLSDTTKAVAQQYGALWADGKIANRAYFLIDKAGTVRWAHAEQHPGLSRQNEEIFAVIKSVTA